MSKSIKEKTGKPCQTSGNIREPEVANRILEDGEADLIAIGRGLIADTEWVNKVQFGTQMISIVVSHVTMDVQQH